MPHPLATEEVATEGSCWTVDCSFSRRGRTECGTARGLCHGVDAMVLALMGSWSRSDGSKTPLEEGTWASRANPWDIQQEVLHW